MSTKEVKDHWKSWADEYGIDLRATTKTWTIKALEIDALARAIKSVTGAGKAFTALEAGCGNGANCIDLAERFPEARFEGFDYVAEMVDAASKNRDEKGGILKKNLRFFQGDVSALSDVSEAAESYDIVFTDRCLINLTDSALQKQGIAQLAAKVRPGGSLIMIENVKQTYDRQNQCRVDLGLSPRTPASFNLFFDETEILPHVESCGFSLVGIDDFGSLHDLVLYALVPAQNGGEVDYGHPLVEAATVLSLKTAASQPSSFGQFGQNRLYHYRKK